MKTHNLITTLAAFLVLFVSDSTLAESRLQVGPVYIDGENDYGPDPGFGPPHDDWRSVDRGNGIALAFQHQWDRLYIGVDAARLRLKNRNDRIAIVCGTGGPSPVPPPFDGCQRVIDAYRYDDRYIRFELDVGWRQPLSESVTLTGELGFSHERWSNSGGNIVFVRESNPIDPFPVDDESSSQTSWSAGISAEVDLTTDLLLSVGIDYQHESYYAAVFRQREPGLGRSLLEGVLRAQQALGERFDVFLEYRPSDQRQYWHAGVGYRF